MAVVKDSLTSFYHANGLIVSPEIGPAVNWHSLNWRIQLEPNTQYKLGILAYNKTNREWESYREISEENHSFSLADLNASVYSKIKLSLSLNSETF